MVNVFKQRKRVRPQSACHALFWNPQEAMKKDVIEAATAPPNYTIRSFLEYAYLRPALKSAFDRGDNDEEAQLQNWRIEYEGACLVPLKRYPSGMTSPPYSPR